MSASVRPQLSEFALDVAEGLSARGQKKIAPRYFYDDLGSSLFEAITLLPEYGLTRADERLLRLYSREIGTEVGPVALVAELGSGNGKKTRHILQALPLPAKRKLIYRPIDVSGAALDACRQALENFCKVIPVCADWTEGLSQVSRLRRDDESMLLLFLGSSIGNLDRECVVDFLQGLRLQLRPGDFLLLGADLVKDPETMLAAYDDPTGVTAAFNLNVLARINRELDGNFDLRLFAHEARWNSEERRIEMHLLSCRDQHVDVGALDTTFNFKAGETIWTESSHKFTEAELDYYARLTGFHPISIWIDNEWPFAEALWRVPLIEPVA
jgi:L-histidine Nalpha-methyltransferase